MRAAWVVVAAACVLASGAADDKKAKIKEATERIARVRAATDIRAPGSVPFRLRARLQMADWFGGSCAGTYLLVWFAPDQWQEHTKCGELDELRTVRGDTQWIMRQPEFLPQRLIQLRSVLNFPRGIQVRKSEKVKRLLPQDKGRSGMECVELGQRYSLGWQMCFDQNPDRLARRLVTGLDQTWILELADYATVGQKIFPLRISYFEGSKKIIDIAIDELSQAQSSASSLEPPAGATPWPWCEDPILAGSPMGTSRDLDPSPNQFGPSYRWRLVFYAVIDTNGKATNLRMIENDRPDLEQHALKALQSTRFTPAKCKGRSVKSERTFQYQIYTHVTP